MPNEMQLVAEADAFLGYRSSVLGSWQGPVSNAKRNLLLLFLRRKFAVTKSVLKMTNESFKALYESAKVIPRDEDHESRKARRRSKRADRRDEGSRRRSRGWALTSLLAENNDFDHCRNRWPQCRGARSMTILDGQG